jgi:hypothetical protein
MNARDKMPFEVTPIFYKLQRYDEPGWKPRRRRSQLSPAQPRLQRPIAGRGSNSRPLRLRQINNGTEIPSRPGRQSLAGPVKAHLSELKTSITQQFKFVWIGRALCQSAL